MGRIDGVSRWPMPRGPMQFLPHHLGAGGRFGKGDIRRSHGRDSCGGARYLVRRGA